MKVETKVKSKVDTKEVKKKTQDANFKSVNEAVGTIRKYILTTIHSGRSEKLERQASKPGETPRRWKNKSDRTIAKSKTQSRNILFSKAVKDVKGRSSAMVYASPHQSGDRVFQMLERGGSQKIDTYPDRLTYKELQALAKYNKLLKTANIVANRKSRRTKEDHGWGWKKWKGYRPLSERSDGERRHIRDYYNNYSRDAALASGIDKISRSKFRKVKKTGKYKPRPFMMPAVKRLLPQFPKIWKTYIQKTYR